MASQLSSLQLIAFAFLTFLIARPRIKVILVVSLLTGELALQRAGLSIKCVHALDSLHPLRLLKNLTCTPPAAPGLWL